MIEKSLSMDICMSEVKTRTLGTEGMEAKYKIPKGRKKIIMEIADAPIGASDEEIDKHINQIKIIIPDDYQGTMR